MSLDRGAFAAQVICLYLDDPDTPDIPSSADWDIACNLFDLGIPIDLVRHAFQLAFARRHRRSGPEALPPIRSLAYFRTVALNLTPEERDPAYMRYIDDVCRRTRYQSPTATTATLDEIRVP